MTNTLGDVGGFTAGTVADVLEQAKRHAREEGELAGRRRADETQDENLRAFAARTAAVVARVLFAILLIVVLVGAYFSLPDTRPTNATQTLQASLFSILVAAAVLGVLNSVFGTTVADLERRVEASLFARLASALRRVVRLGRPPAAGGDGS
jgi:heme A synthase